MLALGFNGERETVQLTPEEVQTVNRRLDKLEHAIAAMDGLAMTEHQLDRLASMLLGAQRLAIRLFRERHRR